jgi:sulfite exporter TauE/SafE
MIDFIVAFITGLTTGGLSCLAVQGGLLASSMANQIEQDLRQAPPARKGQRPLAGAQKPRAARPIVLFLLAKLAAYTLLGLLLGALGSVLQLTPLTRAIMLLAIGIFMLGNGLRMLNVHPIFRWFAIEPPSALTRFIRRTAKKNSSDLNPLFLGALTIFIPCGITQSMMALAIGSGQPLYGAAIMFSFILGTSPVFFTVAYLTARLGARLEANFMRFVAAVVLILGVVTINSGLNLIGSPLSLSSMARAVYAWVAPGPSAAPATQNKVLAPAGPDLPAPASPSDTSLVIQARNNGYAPEQLQARSGTAITLNVVTNNTRSCSRAFVIPALGIERVLPETGSETFQIPPQPRGTVLEFTCSMGMYSGQITFNN